MQPLRLFFCPEGGQGSIRVSEKNKSTIVLENVYFSLTYSKSIGSCQNRDVKLSNYTIQARNDVSLAFDQKKSVISSD